MRFILALLFCLLACGAADAQSGNPTRQSGNVTPGHVTCWTTNGIVQDCSNPSIPFATYFATVGQGPTLCANSSQPSSGTYQQICLGVTNSGGGQITVQNYGSAPAEPLTFLVNGVPFTFPGAGAGDVAGPGAATVGDVALWNNAAGTLLKDAGGGAPNVPQPHPASGNLVCPSGFGGGIGQPNHVLTWSDQTFCYTGDFMLWESFDPSAYNTITVTGTAATGTLTVTFIFNATTYNIPVAVTMGQTTTQVAAAIVAAIEAAGSAVYNNVAGAQGQILYATNVANQVDYNQNSTVATTIAYTAGATALTLTFAPGQSTPATNYTLATFLDGNPGLMLSRNSGAAPAAGSNLGAIAFEGTGSATPADVSVIYGTVLAQAENSTAGSISGRIGIFTPDVNDNLNGGIYVGRGLYTVGSTDKGVDTIDTPTYWLNNKYSMTDTGGTEFLFSTQSTGNPFVFSSTGGGIVGIGATPTGALDVFGAVSSLQASGLPTTGSGIALYGGATPMLEVYNFLSGATLPLVLNATSFAIPSSSASALAVGLNGATNPAFKVNSATALQVAGLSVSGAVTGGTVAVAVIDSGSAANLDIEAKGSGTITIGGVSTGTITLGPAVNVDNNFTVQFANAAFSVVDTGTSYSYGRYEGGGAANGGYVGQNGSSGSLYGSAHDMFLINNESTNGGLVLGSNNVVHEKDFPSGGFVVGAVSDPGANNLSVAGVYKVGTTAGLASKSCLINTANASTGVTLTITGGLITGTTTC